MSYPKGTLSIADRQTGIINYVWIDNEKAEKDRLRLISIDQEMEMDLETVSQSSYPKPGDKDKIIQLFERDLTDGYLGMKSHLVMVKYIFIFRYQ